MKKLKYLLMACCAACVGLAACSDDDYEPLPDWWWEQTGEPAVYPEPEPVDNKVVAHRGCYAETGFPQNSVAGLKKAVEMKLFASECDIHLTKDGKVVVYHDDYYLGNTCFKDATYAELCAKGTLANGEKLPLLEEFGFYAQRLLTFQYEGESGAAKMADIMRKLRTPLDTFADAHFPTATRIDYQNDETGLPKSDVLSFALADGSKIIVRPSGTEPKLKAYLFARGENQAAAEKVLDELETLMNGYCKE